MLAISACATKPVAPDVPLPFPQAVTQATDSLVAQAQAVPAILSFTSRGIVHDPTLDAESGRQHWAYQVPGSDQPATRGVAYWPGDGKRAHEMEWTKDSVHGRAPDGTVAKTHQRKLALRPFRKVESPKPDPKKKK